MKFHKGPQSPQSRFVNPLVIAITEVSNPLVAVLPGRSADVGVVAVTCDSSISWCFMLSPLKRCQKQDGRKTAVVADSSRMVNE